ncbi:MAG: hypothetical protein ACYTDV_20755 [Planctomycetota bacterium]
MVTSVRVAGPVAAEADEDKSTMIIRPEGAERVVRTPQSGQEIQWKILLEG